MFGVYNVFLLEYERTLNVACKVCVYIIRGSFTEFLTCLQPDYSPILSYTEFVAAQTALVFWYNTLSCITRWDICNKLSKTSSPLPLLFSNPFKERNDT